MLKAFLIPRYILILFLILLTNQVLIVVTFWNTMLEMFLNQMILKSCSLIPGITLRIMNFCSLQQEINIFTPNFLYIILVNLIIQLGLYHLIAMLMILYVHNQY